VGAVQARATQFAVSTERWAWQGGVRGLAALKRRSGSDRAPLGALARSSSPQSLQGQRALNTRSRLAAAHTHTDTHQLLK